MIHVHACVCPMSWNMHVYIHVYIYFCIHACVPYSKANDCVLAVLCAASATHIVLYVVCQCKDAQLCLHAYSFYPGISHSIPDVLILL